MNSQFAMPVSIGSRGDRARGVVEYEHGLVGQDHGRRQAQHVGALVEHDLDVGAVAREEPGLLGVVELGFDLDRARLLLLIEHVRRHAAHVPRERAVGKGVEADPCGQAGADARRVDLVDRRADVQARSVDQIDGRRRRDADRRRRDELAELAVDLGDDAGERRAELRALEMGFRDVDARIGDSRRIFGRGARGRRRLRAAFGLIGRFLRREPIRAQRRRARGIAFGDVGDDARFARARARRERVALRQRQLGFEIGIPELEQQRARLRRARRP